MSAQDSQERSTEKEFSYAELCERARKIAAELAAREAELQKKGKGLDFMAYRIDVAKKHFELSVKRKVTPAEGNLLLFLELGTIGAQNSRSQITSKAEFYIEDLSKALGYKEKAKIWRLLKSLHTKGYIIREKTRSKNREILGLNPEVFTQILIDKYHEIDKKRHLRIAVDNTKPRMDNSSPESGPERTDHSVDTNEPLDDHELDVQIERTNRSRTDSQVPEVTRENIALDSSRFQLDLFRGQNGNEETNVSLMGTGPGRTPAEHARMIREQLEMAKAGKL